MDSKKFTVLENGEISVILEYNEDWVAVHLGAETEITPKSYKWLKERAAGLNDFVETAGYPPLMAAIPKDSGPFSKFVEKCGFEYKGSHDIYDVYAYTGGQ